VGAAQKLLWPRAMTSQAAWVCRVSNCPPRWTPQLVPSI